VQAGVVELELLERVAQFLELIRVGGIQTRENHRLGFLVPGKRLLGAPIGVE
jgi:hypothetical protein